MRKIHPKSIVLNPASNSLLTPEDGPLAERYGVVALDCSWNLSEEIFQRGMPGDNRRLPLLLAGNPTNYGALGKLTTAEALAGALYVTGHTNQAKRLLSLFKWGNTFLTLNKDPLESYRQSSEEDLPSLEKQYFGFRLG